MNQACSDVKDDCAQGEDQRSSRRDCWEGIEIVKVSGSRTQSASGCLLYSAAARAISEKNVV
jgi:hypothetical protein